MDFRFRKGCWRGRGRGIHIQHFLQELVVGNIFAFLLIFMRFGTALMIMPGIGATFVPAQIRLLFALALSFVLTPVLAPHLPTIPENTSAFLALLISEAVIGFFIGTVMRILVSALDTAGTIVSIQAGFSNATLFNPAADAQGSIMSAVYSSLGVTIMLAADLHHQMLAVVVDSYQLYPANGVLLDMDTASDTIGKIAAVAFKIGTQIAIPFLIVGTLVQMGFGVLGRLLPQVQVFFLAMPAQIFLSMLILVLTLTAGIVYWLNGYETILSQALVP
ncbi:MAG: flagellar biosynthetic protein FliR [Proteobacteria bacterium]|nr:flagellar biosynthetic protein FliR [Pseudomonadota bacterium]